MDCLNYKQKEAFKRAMKNENLFISGSAGVGKSFLLKIIVASLRSKWKRKNAVAVTALTGLAAKGINGSTLHSFAGFGYDLSKTPTLFVEKRWSNTKTLIIDEVSMLTREFLEKIYKYLKKYRIQLILFGDLLQLPPVSKYGEDKMLPAYTSSVWKKLGLCGNGTFILTEVVRQKDAEFIKVLNEIRVGNISSKSKEFLKMIGNKKRPNSQNLTKLYSTNNNVDAENIYRLKQLPDKEIVLKCIDKYSNGMNKTLLKMMNQDSKEEIKVKLGARVMNTRNRIGSIIVNGSLGKIVGFSDDGSPFVSFDCMPNAPIMIERVEFEIKMGREKMIRKQYPLKLAYALSTHRAQGMTLDKVEANIKNSFDKGQIYTCLSRVKTPEGLWIDDVDALLDKNKVCEMALEYYKNNG